MYDVIKAQLKAFFQDAGFAWGVCGGLAIDFFTGQSVRDHKDIDLFAYPGQRNAVVTFMLSKGWRVFEACGNGIQHEILRPAPGAVNLSLYCLSPANRAYRFAPQSVKNAAISRFRKDEPTIAYLEGLYQADAHMGCLVSQSAIQTSLDYIEFLFSNREGAGWVYPDHAAVRLEWGEAVLERDGVAFLAPQIVLLYKIGIAARLKSSADAAFAACGAECEKDCAAAWPQMSPAQKAWLQSAVDRIYPDQQGRFYPV